MENRTEIGKAIKNKLADLDKNPSDFVWSKIETDLNKKRTKRILYWLVPGVMAIVLFFSVLYFNSVSQDQDQKTETKKNTKTEIDNSKSQQTQIQNSAKAPKTKSKLQQSAPDEITTIKKSKTVKLIKESSKLITATEEYEEYEVVKKYKVVVRKEQISTKPVKLGAVKRTTKPTAPKNTKTPIKTNTTVLANSRKTGKSHKVKHNTKAVKKSVIAETPKKLDSEEVPILQKNSETAPKAVETKVDTIAKIDSITTKKKTTPKREYIKREYNNKSDESAPDFSVHVFYGPAIFGSLNSASMISSTMDDLSKSHPITSHYGVYVKTMYDRIGFRAGFSKINLKISTRLDQNLITDFRNIELKSQTNIKNTFSNSNEVDLVQKLSYYELPMEFDYAIKKDDTKIGMDVFTGFSFLILDKNQLSLKSEKVAMQNIGEAKNLSGVNFSYNLGIGITYQLNDKFGLDINPLFKYYLSTFNESGAAKPYSFSIQTGINYKF